MGGYSAFYSLNIRINKDMRDRIDKLMPVYTQPAILEAGVNALEQKEELKNGKGEANG